jgi:hypothetical protein
MRDSPIVAGMLAESKGPEDRALLSSPKTGDALYHFREHG